MIIFVFLYLPKIYSSLYFLFAFFISASIYNWIYLFIYLFNVYMCRDKYIE